MNVLFWRPLTAWAERFRLGDSAGVEVPRSVTLDVLRRSRSRTWSAARSRPAGAGAGPGHAPVRAGRAPAATTSRSGRRAGDVVFAVALRAGASRGVCGGCSSTSHATHRAGRVRPRVRCSGLVTFARVVVLVVVATLVWVPIGVWIGMNPRVCRLAQPVVQVLASFPANFLFPLFTLLLIAHRGQPQHRRHPADEPGRAVVHPVQRHRRRHRDPHRPARGGDQPAPAPLAAVAAADPARRSSPPRSPAASPPPAGRGTPPSSPRSSPTAAPP